MNGWFVKKKLVAVAFFILIFCDGSLAQDRRQNLIDKTQEELYFWNVLAADEAVQELFRLDPKNDVTLYLLGTVSFFKGDYKKADQSFKQVKDLKRFESDKDGFAYLTQDILKRMKR